MLNKFLPNEYVKNIYEIDPKTLKNNGIKGIITDLDNTLVPWDMRDATPEVIEWFERLEEHEIKITIISNNKEERVRIFSEPLEVPFISKARKPLRRAFNRGAKLMDLHNKEVAVIGDQLLTDVLGGNRAGFYTILVVPIVQTDAKITRINRMIERRILRYFKNKGKISWEDES